METLKAQIAAVPRAPGIYRYFDAQGTIIYVGKAKDLKKRVSQYFQKGDVALGPKTQQLVEQIARIEITETVSEFDALMLEAQLIRTHLPKYNVIAKDDKSPIYLVVTKEELPRLTLTRKPKSTLNPLNSKPYTLNPYYYGPFQSATVLRFLMRTIRRIVPYCTSKERRGRRCFYTHLGLCDPCPAIVAKMSDGPERQALVKRYQSNIRKIRALFSGKSTTLLNELEQDMHAAAKTQEFERAASLKLSAIRLRELMEHHYSPTLYLQTDTAVEDLHNMELTKLREILLPHYPNLNALARIECMDISNLQGKQATGSMVVLTHGRPDASQYRRFRIRSEQTPNDVRMMTEVITRRLKHDEWPTPDLLIIDGGKAQVGAVMEVLEQQWSAIPVIGIAKRFEELIIPPEAPGPGLGGTNRHKGGWATITIPLNHPALHVVQRIRDEAHRFAITYHRLLRKKTLTPRVSRSSVEV